MTVVIFIFAFLMLWDNFLLTSSDVVTLGFAGRQIWIFIEGIWSFFDKCFGLIVTLRNLALFTSEWLLFRILSLMNLNLQLTRFAWFMWLLSKPGWFSVWTVLLRFCCFRSPSTVSWSGFLYCRGSLLLMWIFRLLLLLQQNYWFVLTLRWSRCQLLLKFLNFTLFLLAFCFR